MTTVLRWVGLFPATENWRRSWAASVSAETQCPPEIAKRGFTDGGIRVRALVCAPAVRQAEAREVYSPREEVLTFVHAFPTMRSEHSGTRYNFSDWGPWLEPLVRYFNDLGAQREPDLDELYLCTGAISEKTESD